MEHKRRLSLLVLVFASTSVIPSPAADPSGKVTASWDKVTRVSQTTPTLQVVVNPPLRRGTPAYAANPRLDGDGDGVACE